MGEMRKCKEIQEDYAEILRGYFRTGRLRAVLSDGLRDSLIDYWEAPFLLSGYFLPCGAVRRVLRSADRIRHGSARARKIPIEAEAYPTYLTYSAYERELIRIVRWY